MPAPLSQIQRKWVYLEPIFRKGALPAEAPRFRRIDADFATLMAAVAQPGPSLAADHGTRGAGGAGGRVR